MKQLLFSVTRGYKLDLDGRDTDEMIAKMIEAVENNDTLIDYFGDMLDLEEISEVVHFEGNAWVEGE